MTASCWCLKTLKDDLRPNVWFLWPGGSFCFKASGLQFGLNIFSEINFLKNLGQGCSSFVHVWATRELGEEEICEEVWTGQRFCTSDWLRLLLPGALWGTRVQGIHPPESGLHDLEDCFAYLSQILYHYPFQMGQSKVQCTSLSWNFSSPMISKFFWGGVLSSQTKGNLVRIIFCKGKDIMITMPNA